MNNFSEEIVNSFNKLAENQEEIGNYENALSYWKQAIGVIQEIEGDEDRDYLFMNVFTRMGCFFKRILWLDKALECFFKVVERGKRYERAVAVCCCAAALLNICTILSGQGKHLEALGNARSSVELLKKHWKNQEEFFINLVISYHSLGTEYQYLRNKNNAEKAFRNAWSLSAKHFGLKHFLSQMAKKSLIPYKKIPLKQPPIQTTFTSRPKSQNCIKRHSKFANSPQKLNFPIIRHIPSPNISILHQTLFISPSVNRTFKPAPLKKKIDVNQFKAEEKKAATIIQSWWRGELARKKYSSIIISKKLKSAEFRARKAVEEYEILRRKSEKVVKARKKFK